ncbi:copper amine oxidase-like protein [Fontibacillus phaseoli]|uniref:Copper amine oxidase-like protein n=1 Tax=Fontibacillus phaseoli TaxID=1416533 RepID=A0A369AZE1_9BACL|nr:copper amine oxidase N-terminal domain-containing protein [Fontibacillus phaseoli]RCX14445.1 copper amine oxidase-like protein [Fontibacillus phaseoli]
MKNSKSTAAKAAAVALVLTVTMASGSIPCLSPNPAAAATDSVNQKATVMLEHKPFKQSGQLYVPLREVAALFDLQLTYNHATKSLELTGVTQYAKLKAGNASATGKNNVVVSLGAPVLIKQGITYVPASLFAKLFGISITPSGKQEITFVYSSKYVMAQAEGKLFWLNREKGVLYMGTSGRLPARAGSINVEHPDLLWMDAHKINDSTYVTSIYNSYGEPHIFDGRYRAILHNGSIIRQASMSYGGPSSIHLEKDVLTYDGKIILNNGQTAELVTPDGKVADIIDLEKIGGPDDVYSLEVMESDFLLIRPYSTGTLLLVDRSSGEATSIYLSMLDKASIDRIQNDEFGIGDGLKYTGRTGDRLNFKWQLPNLSSEAVTKTYDLSKKTTTP